MNKPKLIIIAGPNGAGKSTVSNDIVEKFGIESFDFDKEYYNRWSEFNYDPVVQQGVKQSVTQYFEDSFENAIKNGQHFSFETNYHTEEVLSYLETANSNGYETTLVFMGLKSAKLAQKRVDFRVEQGGHFVPKEEIENRFISGLKLLDSTYSRYHKVFIQESLPDFRVRSYMSYNTHWYIKGKPSFLNYLPNIKKSY